MVNTTPVQIAVFGDAMIAGIEHQMVAALDPATPAHADILITKTAGWEVLKDKHVDAPVLVTADKEGVHVHRPGSADHIPAHTVELFDATGAGDAFAGAQLGPVDPDLVLHRFRQHHESGELS